MELNNARIGFAMTGSFCTFAAALTALEELTTTGARITPILSFNAANLDTRFMAAKELKARLVTLTGNEPVESIVAAEPIGPKKLLDLLIIAPCTGNTIAKIATGVTDTPVTMAAKAHLRNERPVLIAVSTNDGLAANARNIGQLFNTRHMFFVPFGQDDCMSKRTSLVADMSRVVSAAALALNGQQLEPVLL